MVAAVKTCTELIGLAQLAYDWGIEMECRVCVDSVAAIGVVNRRGNGKLRHVRVGMLWVQEKVEEEVFKVHKVRGDRNVADLMTKYVPRKKIDELMQSMGQNFEDGRADASLELH